MIAQPLDPFGYWPAQRSRIRPLGGKNKSEDPSYVFHTSYVAAAPGPSIAEIEIAGLTADVGMLAVRIFQHLPEGKPPVTERGKITVLLPSLAKAPRRIRLPFEALPDALYAVTGYVYGECSARADSIAITIASRTGEDEDPSRRRSLFGRLKARRASAMISSTEPQLAWPVSQGFTTDQVDEPDFKRLDAQLAQHGSVKDRWEAAYIVRVLEEYGRLQPEARGLAASAHAEPIAAFANAAGCAMRAIALQSGESLDAACAAQAPGSDGVGFDFAYTRSNTFGAGDVARALKLIEDLLARLRPGGLAIVMANTGPQLDRHGLNRVALEIAAQGHFTAQLRHGETPGPFGLVVRAATENIIA